MGLLREVDTWADDTDVSAEDVVGGLNTFDLFRGRYPLLAPETIGEVPHGKMLKRAENILHLGALASVATRPARYVGLRILEADESVNLFADTATPDVSEQSGFETDFMPNLRALGEAATLWDSLIDGSQDYREGKQLLKPSAEYYQKVIGAMIQRGMVCDRSLIHWGPFKFIVVKGGLRVVNRVKNGIPEYSNLYRFTRHKGDQR